MKILDEAMKNYQLMMKLADYPDCFDSKKQFKDWSEFESIAHTKPKGLPCRDCIPEFQQRMAAEGRCANAKVVNITRIMHRVVKKDE